MKIEKRMKVMTTLVVFGRLVSGCQDNSFLIGISNTIPKPATGLHFPEKPPDMQGYRWRKIKRMSL